MKTSEVLRKAADEIRRRGWHQGAMGSSLVDRESCSLCAAGALNVVLGGDPWSYALIGSDASRAMLDVTGASPLIEDWNDDPERTVDEVLDAFERAAVTAEASGD